MRKHFIKAQRKALQSFNEFFEKLFNHLLLKFFWLNLPYCHLCRYKNISNNSKYYSTHLHSNFTSIFLIQISCHRYFNMMMIRWKFSLSHISQNTFLAACLYLYLSICWLSTRIYYERPHRMLMMCRDMWNVVSTERK